MISATDPATMPPASPLLDAEAWSADMTTGSGYRFHVRPIRPGDATDLGAFFTHVTPDDLRFRFLSAVHTVPQQELALLTQMDHCRTEGFVAIDPAGGAIIASAMIAADAALTSAEVAIAIRGDFKDRGIGWTLLEHVTRYAQARGFKSLESTESRDNHRAIELEREMGFKVLPCPGDETLCILRATFA